MPLGRSAHPVVGPPSVGRAWNGVTPFASDALGSRANRIQQVQTLKVKYSGWKRNSTLLKWCKSTDISITVRINLGALEPRGPDTGPSQLVLTSLLRGSPSSGPPGGQSTQLAGMAAFSISVIC